MLFRKSARITVENIDTEPVSLFYQVDYTLTERPEKRRLLARPVPAHQPGALQDRLGDPQRSKTLGGIRGDVFGVGSPQQRVGGEGEIKFFIDGDTQFPTIGGTGTEDYFCGSTSFETGPRDARHYQDFIPPYTGFSVVPRPDSLYDFQERFSLCRWHIMDPVRFEQDLRVTIQDLGWRVGGRYLLL